MESGNMDPISRFHRAASPSAHMKAHFGAAVFTMLCATCGTFAPR
jgi:hypothetical protein